MTSHRAPFESLAHLPADIIMGAWWITCGLAEGVWDELSRWRVVRLPANVKHFDPRLDVVHVRRVLR